MTHTIDVDELIARPLDVIARLRAELKEEHGDDAQDGPLLALAILRALSSGAPPALEQVPVLSRESLAEVRGLVVAMALRARNLVYTNSCLREAQESIGT